MWWGWEVSLFADPSVNSASREIGDMAQEGETAVVDMRAHDRFGKIGVPVAQTVYQLLVVLERELTFSIVLQENRTVDQRKILQTSGDPGECGRCAGRGTDDC